MINLSDTLLSNIANPQLDTSLGSGLVDAARVGQGMAMQQNQEQRAQELAPELLKQQAATAEMEEMRLGKMQGAEKLVDEILAADGINDIKKRDAALYRLQLTAPEEAESITKYIGIADKDKKLKVGMNYYNAIALCKGKKACEDKFLTKAVTILEEHDPDHPFVAGGNELIAMPESDERTDMIVEGMSGLKTFNFFPQDPTMGKKTQEQIERELDLKASAAGLREEETAIRTEEHELKKRAASSDFEKMLDTDRQAGRKNELAANKMFSLSSDFSKMAPDMSPGGVLTKLQEGFKKMFGTQDWETQLRLTADEVLVSAAIGNLPPGVASDKDIEMVRGAFPGSDADPGFLSNYFQIIGRLKAADQVYQQEKVKFGSKQRPPTYVGFDEYWEQNNEQLLKDGFARRNVDWKTENAGPATPGTVTQMQDGQYQWNPTQGLSQ